MSRHEVEKVLRKSVRNAGGGKKVGPGDVLCGYRIVRLLGTGSFGAVYEVTKSGKTYALKISKTSTVVSGLRSKGEEEDANGIDTGLLLEAAMYRTIKHPNIVSAEHVAFSCVDPSSLILVLEKGEPLDDWQAVHPLNTNRSLKNDKTQRNLFAQHLHIMQGIACGARHLRRNGIVHFDIKPANVLMVDGDAKLFDFGLAEKWPHIRPPFTTPEVYSGTPDYMPPEELCPAYLGRGKSYAADVWAIGVTFFELMFGRMPFANITVENPAGDMLAIVNVKNVPSRTWINTYISPHTACRRVLDDAASRELDRFVATEDEDEDEEEEEEEDEDEIDEDAAESGYDSPSTLDEKRRRIASSAGGENDVRKWLTASERKTFTAYYGVEVLAQLLASIQRMLRWEPTEREIDFSSLPNPEPCAVSVQVFMEPKLATKGDEKKQKEGKEEERGGGGGGGEDSGKEEDFVDAKTTPKTHGEDGREIVPAIFRHVRPLIPGDVYADMINIWHKLRCAHLVAKPNVGDVLAIASLASKLANTNTFRKTLETRWKKGEFVGKEHEFVYAVDFDLLGPPTCTKSHPSSHPPLPPPPSAPSSAPSSSSPSSSSSLESSTRVPSAPLLPINAPNAPVHRVVSPIPSARRKTHLRREPELPIEPNPTRSVATDIKPKRSASQREAVASASQREAVASASQREAVASASQREAVASASQREAVASSHPRANPTPILIPKAKANPKPTTTTHSYKLRPRKKT
jgi:serine/threonine protein kinase